MSNPFVGFPKLGRWRKDVVITEKLDGTNACVVVGEDGSVTAQSRSRAITVGDDNFGFAKWVADNTEELRSLGVGYNFGEWIGAGIQRKYGLDHRRFYLFPIGRKREIPACCYHVPTLYTGPHTEGQIDRVLADLVAGGSVAVPGFLAVEGIVIYHTGNGACFKKTVGNDGHKGEQ